MKKSFVYFCIVLFAGLLWYSSAQAQRREVRGEPITYQEFYDGLSPYGTWIDYPAYGHVWHPNVGADFRPYATNGHWEYTDTGWFWDSGYDWGWAPFHYGSWFYDDLDGWLWIPGVDWAPAWVTWGMVDDFYAWAPIGPDVDLGVEFGDWFPHPFYWNMVDRAHVYDRDLAPRLLDADRVRTEASRVNIIRNFDNNPATNRFFATGPDVREVNRFTNHEITPVPIHDVRTAAEHSRTESRMNVYRPAIQRPEPAQYSKARSNEVRPVHSSDNHWPSTNPAMHQQHIQNMPVQQGTPMHFTGGGAPRGGGGAPRGGGRR